MLCMRLAVQLLAQISKYFELSAALFHLTPPLIRKTNACPQVRSKLHFNCTLRALRNFSKTLWRKVLSATQKRSNTANGHWYAVSRQDAKHAVCSFFAKSNFAKMLWCSAFFALAKLVIIINK